jgi:DNA-binding transcriptional LysR family regulator
MDLRQIRYFVMLASERNFTRAADRLHIAQPPLSRQIQQLENELGVELIDRAVRPLKLTSAGHLFHEQALQVLSRVEDMQSMVGRAGLSDRRRFTIGFVASTIYARLPALIRQFRVEAPKVDLSLVEIVRLKDGRIDLGFGRIRFEDPAVRRTVLREERLVAAVPVTHPLVRDGAPVSLGRLAAEPLILYPRAPRPSYADQVLSLFHDQGLQPRIAQEARELQIAIGLVAAEEGICIVPESVRQSRTEDVRYLELSDLATSPIIMSQRVGDRSPHIDLMSAIIVRTYSHWGYPIPESMRKFAQAHGPSDGG